MKVLWQESLETWVPYNKDIHLKEAWLFLFWEKEEILLIGWSCDFQRKIEQQFLRRLHHQNLYEWAKELAPKRNPDGAGCISSGKVELWGSGDFQLITPKSMRPKILKALGIKE